MIDLTLNSEGKLTPESEEAVEALISDVAQKCLVAIASLTPEDLRAYRKGSTTENIKNIAVLLEQIVVEEDLPVIFTSAIAGQLKIVNTLLSNIEHSFVNAQNIIALDAMGKTKETEVSVRDVREAYEKIIAKKTSEKTVE